MEGTIFGLVMLSQLLSYLIGRHADNGVLTRIEVLRKLEKFYAYRAFFENSGRTTDCMHNDVLQELPASLAGTKRRTIQQATEFRPHVLLSRDSLRSLLPHILVLSRE